MKFKVLLLLAFFALMASPAFATDQNFYTAKLCSAGAANPNCSDLNNGTSAATAKLTIMAGAALLGSCDILNVGAGTYNELVTTAGIPSGSPGCFTRILGPDAGVSKAGWVGMPGSVFVAYSGDAGIYFTEGKSYIRFDGIGGSGENRTGNRDWPGCCGYVFAGTLANPIHHVEVLNGEFKNSICGAHGGGFMDDVIIRGNWTHGDSCRRFSHGWYMSAGTRWLFEGNLTEGMAQYGIQVYYQDFAGPTFLTFRNNIWRSNGYGVCEDATGCTVGAMHIGSGMSIGGADNLVYNELFVGNAGAGVAVQYSAPVRTKIYNNTIWDNRWTGTYAGTSQVDTTWINNIVWGNGTGTGIDIAALGTGMALLGDLPLAGSTNNLCQVPNGSASWIQCTVTSNPLFISTGTGDFRIPTSSPAKNVGTTLTEFNNDAFGTARPQGDGWEFGYYEFSSGSSRTITVTDSFTGTAPDPLTSPNWQQQNDANTTMIYAASNRVTSTPESSTQEGVAIYIGPGAIGDNQFSSLELVAALPDDPAGGKLFGVGGYYSGTGTTRYGYNCYAFLSSGTYITAMTKTVNGAIFTLAATTVVPWTVGDRNEFEGLNTGQKTCLKSGVGTLTVVDADVPAGGSVGVSGTGDSDVLGDNFQAGYIGTSPTSPETVYAVTGGELGLTEYLITAGTISSQATVKRSGVGSIRVNPTTSATGLFTLCALSVAGLPECGESQTTRTLSGYLRVDTAPSANYEIVAVIQSESEDKGIVLVLDSARKLRVYPHTANTLGAQCGSTGATVLTLTSQYLLGFKATKGAAGAFEVRIAPDNNTPSVSEISGTCNSGTVGGIGYGILGKYFNLNSETVDFYYDDWALTSDFLGPHRVLNLQPDAAGNYAECNNGTGNTFAEIDDFTASVAHDTDTTYIGETGSAACNHSLNVLNPNPGGVTGVIRAVQAWCFMREVTADTSACGIRYNGVNTLVEQAALTSSYRAYASILERNPDTHSAWTSSNVEGVEVMVNSATGAGFRWTAGGLSVLFDDSSALTGGASYYYRTVFSQ